MSQQRAALHIISGTSSKSSSAWLRASSQRRSRMSLTASFRLKINSSLVFSCALAPGISSTPTEPPIAVSFDNCCKFSLHNFYLVFHSKCRARARAIHWRYDSAMPDYRRAHVPGGTYFFTVNIYRRQTFLTDVDVRSALREAIGTLRLTHPFVCLLLLQKTRQRPFENPHARSPGVHPPFPPARIAQRLHESPLWLPLAHRQGALGGHQGPGRTGPMASP